MTERELFEESEFVKTIIHNFEWNDDFNNYQIKDCVINGNVFEFIEAEKDQLILNGAWCGWQASASREGYKLVPVETLEAALEWFNCVEHDWLGASDLTEDYKHKGIIEKAMIGAGE